MNINNFIIFAYLFYYILLYYNDILDNKYIQITNAKQMNNTYFYKIIIISSVEFYLKKWKLYKLIKFISLHIINNLIK